VQGQVADDLEAILVQRTDLLRGELDAREALDVEEVGGAQVVVALRLLGVHAGRLDVAVGPGGGEIIADLERALERAEVAAHGRDTEMANRELDARVGRIDAVGAGRDGRGEAGAHVFPLCHPGAP
jgi:hypothetical protein